MRNFIWTKTEWNEVRRICLMSSNKIVILELRNGKNSVKLNLTQFNSSGIKLSFGNLWVKVEIN